MSNDNHTHGSTNWHIFKTVITLGIIGESTAHHDNEKNGSIIVCVSWWKIMLLQT